MAVITIIGCGPGSPDYLTPIAHRAAMNADILVGAKRLLELFPECKAERIIVGVDIESVLDKIEVLRQAQGAIAVLVTGDPGLYSLARPVIQRFGRDRCRVIAGVSSVQAACAAVGVDWHDAKILSAHGRYIDIDPESLAGVKKIAILAGGEGALEQIAELVNSLDGTRRVFVCENLTLDDERVREIESSALAGLDAASACIVLLIEENLL
jgi:cobalt-precorrin-7 (C5)-methyltransferase